MISFRVAVLLMTMVGFHAVADAGHAFCRLDKQGDRWLVRDASDHQIRILGVDQVRWDGMPCERMNWRRPYEEHNRQAYPDRRAWEAETLGRLKSWGFNMLGACSDESLRHRGLLHAIFLNMSEGFCDGENSRWYARFKGVPNTAMPNVFHPDFADYCDRIARERCAPHREDKDLLGYFIDNELVWQAADDPARTAERYFQLTTEAIKRYDPNHLILGCRFAGLDGAPESVWKVAGRYCDVVTFNCYPWADLVRNCVLDAKGGRSIVSRFEEIHRLTGRPLLITEWSFPALDTGRPCLNGAGQRFSTQEERVAATELFARTMLAQPYILGHSYFMWLDQPALGTNGEFPEDCNYGLVSETGVPYESLVRMFTALNQEARSCGKSFPAPRVKPASHSRRGPSTADAFRSMTSEVCDPVGFERSGDRWRMTNGRVCLSGSCTSGVEMVGAVSRDGVSFGRYNGMVQVLTATGESLWITADTITDVSFASADSSGEVLITGVGRCGGVAVEMVHRITLSTHTAQFLCEVVRIRNIGQDEFTLRRIYLCPLFAGTIAGVRKGVPNLWKGPRECHWEMSDGRSYGMYSSDSSAEWFNLWIDQEGRQHPDINFLPNGTVRLSSGQVYVPNLPMGAIAVLQGGASSAPEPGG